MSTATVNRCLALRNATYPEPEWPDEIHRAAVRRAAAGGAVLVDVGCGRQASDLRVLAPSFERACGVDVDLRPHREANWELVPADGHRLPFPDGAADVVAMNDVVLEHRADPVAAFRDCLRVRPGIRRDDRFAGVRQFLHADFRKPR